nr:unnamed protein product [Callosobruchus analis]
MAKTKFDILCFNEHWCDEEKIKFCAIEGYNLVTYYCRLGVGHGGTAIYSRKELHCIPLPNINNCSKQQQCEIAATKVTEIGLVIISVYRPPSGNLEVFLEIIENILTLVSKHSNVVVAGDFNIHFNYANSQRDRLIDLFDSFNFLKTIHVPTRGSNCLDNIFINFSHEYFKASCDNPVLSDHLSQSLELNLPCKVVERSSNKICRPITKIGKHIFYSLVETINWDFVDDNVLSVDAKFTYLINLLNRTYVEAFREKKVNRSSSKENLKWFCDELALMRETLHFLNSACKRNNTPENINTRNKFRKQYRTAITQAKIKTNDNFIKESPNKSKAIWKIIAGKLHALFSVLTKIKPGARIIVYFLLKEIKWEVWGSWIRHDWDVIGTDIFLMEVHGQLID